MARLAPWSAAHLQEELDQVQVIGLLAAVKLQQSVDTCFQKNRVIHSVQTYAWLSGREEESRQAQPRLTKSLSLWTPRQAAPTSLWPVPEPRYLPIPATLPPSGEGRIHDVV